MRYFRFPYVILLVVSRIEFNNSYTACVSSNKTVNLITYHLFREAITPELHFMFPALKRFSSLILRE